MSKLVIAIVLMIAAAMVASAYLELNPFLFVLIVLAILGFDVYMIGRLAEPLPEGRPIPWGGGQGIYMSPGDKWVENGHERRDDIGSDGDHIP